MLQPRNEGPKWNWIGPTLLVALSTLQVSWLAWISAQQVTANRDIGAIKAALDEQVKAADALHATYATHDEVDVKIERTLRAVDERLRDMSNQLDVRYRGPVNAPGWERSIERERERKRRENPAGDP